MALDAYYAGPGPRAQDANLLLGEALLGRRQFQNAALAFNDAYNVNRRSSRAPEALLGLANSFQGFGARREACDAMLCCLSAGEVMRLTRLGRFDMSAEARGIAKEEMQAIEWAKIPMRRPASTCSGRYPMTAAPHG